MALALIVLIAGCGKKEEPIVAPTQINFAADYQSALKLAQDKGQKVIIDFYADWCTWCKRLDTVTFVDSSVIAMSKDIVFAKINAEVDTATAAIYRVKGYPTVVLANADGSEIDRIGGYLAPSEFKETIENYLKDVNTLNYFLGKADSGATTELNYRIGEKYADRGMYPEAEIYFAKVISADPENKELRTDSAMMAVADIKRRDKKYDEAMAEFKKVMEKFPGTPLATDAEIWTAVVYRQKGDTAKAIEAFENFLKNHPESDDTAYARQQIEKLKNPPPPDSAK
jgi:thiol:disulfide interchange protein DsbD